MNRSISIAIPTLNEEENIKKCLQSIFKQKFKGNLEVFVIDGGSTDKTVQVAKKFKVKILNNPKKDAESGKLIGFKASKGDYFMILDADMQLIGDDWFDKMVKPLEENKQIVGSFTKFVSFEKDSFLSQYITIDPIQRDPLFRFLTFLPEHVVKEKKDNYWICKYSLEKIVPAGFCIYRKKDLLKVKVHQRSKFMELDNLVLFIKNKMDQFAYVPSAGINHPFLKDLKTLIRKRIRNLRQQFFNQPNKREFTWINFQDKKQFLKILIWIIYANSIIIPSLVGLFRAIKYFNIKALFEPIFVWITTNLIIYVFLTEKEGRRLIFEPLKNKIALF